jgi:hypothetical protein
MGKVYRFVREPLLFMLLAHATSVWAARPNLDDPKYAVIPWVPQAKTDFSLDKIFDRYSANPLARGTYPDLCALLDQLVVKQVCDGNRALQLGSELKVSGDPGTLGGSAEISQVVADFLVERAKLEFKAWLLRNVVDHLCDKKDKEETYFPRLCLNASRDDAYSLLRMEEALIRATRRDITELPAYAIWRASDAVEDKRQAWGYVLTNLAIQARDGQKVRALMAGLPQNRAVRDECLDASTKRCTLYFLGLMAQVFEFTKDSKKTDAQERVKETAIFALGLLQEHLCPCINPEREKAWLEKSNGVASLLQGALGTSAIAQTAAQDLVVRLNMVASKAKALDAEANRLEAIIKDPDATREKIAEALGLVLKGSAELGDRLISMLGAQSSTEFLGTRAWKGYVKLLQIAASASAAIESGRYSAAAAEVSDLLVCLKNKENATQYCGTEMPFYADATQLIRQERVVKSISVIAMVADARSGTEARELLDQWASPLGSWRLKRDNSLVSLGAIVGGALGYEHLRAPGISSYGGAMMGTFAPVGIDFSWRCSGSWLCLSSESGTVGFLISLIDFGNVASVRLSDTSTTEVADTTSNTDLKSIASTGIFARWGLGKTPWVFAFGVAYTPGLRTAKLRTGQDIETRSIRVQAGLGMDIPLLYF